MSDVPFHLTVMGRRFYEATMPALVEAIERLNANLERLAAMTPVAAPMGPVAPSAPHTGSDKQAPSQLHTDQS